MKSCVLLVRLLNGFNVLILQIGPNDNENYNHIFDKLEAISQEGNYMLAQITKNNYLFR